MPGPYPMKSMNIGITGSLTRLVTDDTLASHTGSGRVEVFATPNLVLLMEEAAAACLEDYLEPGETTVGSVVNIRHLAPTPKGLTVTASAKLTGIDGRRLIFQVEATDGVDRIGEGTHERFVVQREKFISRAYEKLHVIHKEKQM